MHTSAITIQASSNVMIADYLFKFEAQSEQAATHNLQNALENSGVDLDTYTQPELKAMIKLEQLKLIGDLGLAEVLLRGKLIQEIENEALWSVHPNQYQSMQDAAKDQGISPSEYSNIRNLYNIVFPYLTQVLGLNLALVWEEVGKSNFRELCPYLVRAITGESSTSRNVEHAFEVLAEDFLATNAASGIAMTDDQVQQAIVGQLLEAGQLPNRQLRTRIRPERPASFTTHVVDYIQGDSPIKVVISLVNEEQYAYLMRKLEGSVRIVPTQMQELARSHFGQMITDAR
ncbi:MAG TPA: hypothetical protein PLA02_10550 [Brevefilum fermentans]|jgi:hypothetical protein|nr:hypothetical protein [Brevefilum fermentans]